jgi:DNA-directed RNA polymerase specialized sigma24 family protein
VAQLPLRQRQAVIGWFYEGRSIEEIAGRIGVPPGTVRSWLHGGINTLRRLTLGAERP